ncbi:unnamed protein product [Caenorhabditis angaria]|uniref:Protein YIPF n=1 Tax=Caenorhabditis angaria TaxID=860376 RepID=A0A9P1ICZ7_9PELO|nr:unnamed protein product [Caenorhabditis angaria]
MDLNFQNFESVNTTNDQSGVFGGNIGDRNVLVGGGGPTGGAPEFSDTQSTTSTRKSNLFSLEFYQQFFDVETDQVIKRLMNSVVPTHRNYIQDFLQPIPDLWGPFWVSVTLIFSIGIFGNLAQFIESDGVKGYYGSDFRMVTSASTLIFLYVVVVPLLIYGLLWNRRSEMLHPYVDLVCLYGYSLTIFVPITFLWIIDISWFRWALIFASVGLSGTVLARAIWPAVKNDENKIIAFGTIAGVLILHFLLAFSFKEFYFDSMHPQKSSNELPKIETTLPPSIAGNGSVPEAPSQVSHLLTLPANHTITKKEEPAVSTISPVSSSASTATTAQKTSTTTSENNEATTTKAGESKELKPTETSSSPVYSSPSPAPVSSSSTEPSTNSTNV